LLLLDEPAAGMNETETESLFGLIKKVQARGVTVLIIEHDMPLVMKLCDRITVLNFGKKLAEGTPEEIQNNQAVIEAYLGSEEDDDNA
jgi:branched-chain amino acid transport system ATP-binding protein